MGDVDHCIAAHPGIIRIDRPVSGLRGCEVTGAVDVPVRDRPCWTDADRIGILIIASSIEIYKGIGVGSVYRRGNGYRGQ